MKFGNPHKMVLLVKEVVVENRESFGQGSNRQPEAIS